MNKLDATALQVVGYDLIGHLIWLSCLLELLCMLGLEAFALVKMEHGKISEQGNLLLLVCLFVFLLNEFPEDNHAGLLALLDLTAFLLTLFESDVERR